MFNNQSICFTLVFAGVVAVRELNQSAYNTGILESDRKISNRSKQKRRKVIKSQEDQAKKSVTGLEPHIMFVTLVRCFNCLLCENFQLYKACLIFIACTSVLLKYSFCVSADIQTTKPSVTFADFGDTENILEVIFTVLRDTAIYIFTSVLGTHQAALTHASSRGVQALGNNTSQRFSSAWSTWLW